MTQTPSLSKRNVLEQGRAEFAYKCAEKASKNEHLRKEYQSLVKKLPMLVKTNGLGASLAFLCSKSKEGKYYHEKFDVLDDLKNGTDILSLFKDNKAIQQTIQSCVEKQQKQGNNQNIYKIVVDCVKQNMVAHYEVYSDIADWLKRDEKQLIDLSKKELMEEIINKSSSEYRAVTIEVMAFLSWLKRFVDGLIQEEKKADDNGKG